jgi:hypothetical protein
MNFLSSRNKKTFFLFPWYSNVLPCFPKLLVSPIFDALADHLAEAEAVALPDHIVPQRLQLVSVDDRQRNRVEILFASRR